MLERSFHASVRTNIFLASVGWIAAMKGLAQRSVLGIGWLDQVAPWLMEVNKTPVFGLSSATLNPVAKMCVGSVGSTSTVLTTATGSGTPMVFQVAPPSVDSQSWFTAPDVWYVAPAAMIGCAIAGDTVKSTKACLGVVVLINVCFQSQPRSLERFKLVSVPTRSDSFPV